MVIVLHVLTKIIAKHRFIIICVLDGSCPKANQRDIKISSFRRRPRFFIGLIGLARSAFKQRVACVYRTGNYYARRLAGGFKVFLTRNLRVRKAISNIGRRGHPLESALSAIRHGTTTTRMISSLNSRAVLSARLRNLHLIRRAKTYCFPVCVFRRNANDAAIKPPSRPYIQPGMRKKLSRSLVSPPRRFCAHFTPGISA